jgi:hypothetical protein
MLPESMAEEIPCCGYSVFPLQAGCGQVQSMSGIFSIASH